MMAAACLWPGLESSREKKKKSMKGENGKVSNTALKLVQNLCTHRTWKNKLNFTSKVQYFESQQ